MRQGALGTGWRTCGETAAPLWRIPACRGHANKGIRGETAARHRRGKAAQATAGQRFGPATSAPFGAFAVVGLMASWRHVGDCGTYDGPRAAKGRGPHHGYPNALVADATFFNSAVRSFARCGFCRARRCEPGASDRRVPEGFASPRILAQLLRGGAAFRGPKGDVAIGLWVSHAVGRRRACTVGRLYLE